MDAGNPCHIKPATYSPEWAHELGTGVMMHTDSVVRKMVQCLNGHDLPSNTLGGVEVELTAEEDLGLIPNANTY